MTSDSDPTSIPDPDFVTDENNPTPDESNDARVEKDAGGKSDEKPEDEGFVPGGGFPR